MTYIFTNRYSYKIYRLTKLFNKCTLVAILLLTNISYSQTATAPSLGDGSSGNPYQIATLENLYWLSQQQNNSDGTDYYWARNYIQTADIDASASSGWDIGKGWTPIGNGTRNFTGSYDGNGKIIFKLKISRSSTSGVGFLGTLASNAEIKNLGIVDGNITGLQASAILVGSNKGRVAKCYSTGSVNGTDYTGGLVGVNTGTIDSCYSTSTVTGSANHNGGLVGLNQGGTINSSFATGSVSGTGSNSNSIGGLVGSITSNGKINNCYSTGSVNGKNRLGGLVGELNSGEVNYCFSTGFVANAVYNGGLVGFNGPWPVNTSYWDKQTSGLNYSSGGWGTTTAEMKTQIIYTNLGWDFMGETANGSNDYWELNSAFNNGYPTLSWQSVETAGITTTPTIISGSNIGFTAQSGSISLNFVEMNKVPSNLPGGAVTINKYWDIGDISGGSVKIRLYFITSLISGFSGNPKIIHYNGSSWEVLPSEAPVTVGSLTYVETTNYYSSFSPVSVGDEASPLPVELVSFTCEIVDNVVQLNWKTATEVNNYGFEIQRSIVNDQGLDVIPVSPQGEDRNLNYWEKVGFIEGHGNSSSPKQYTFTDDKTSEVLSIGLPSGKHLGGLDNKLQYRLKQIDFDGKFEYSEIITVEMLGATSLPTQFALEQNYPNPFNPTTSIEYSVPSSEYVSLKVYDILGNEVAQLVNENKNAGRYEVKFNASNLTSGLYIYKIQAGSFNQVRKMMLVK